MPPILHWQTKARRQRRPCRKVQQPLQQEQIIDSIQSALLSATHFVFTYEKICFQDRWPSGPRRRNDAWTKERRNGSPFLGR